MARIKKGILFGVSMVVLTTILLLLTITISKEYQHSTERVLETTSLDRLYEIEESTQYSIKKMLNVQDFNLSVDLSTPSNSATVSFKNFKNFRKISTAWGGAIRDLNDSLYRTTNGRSSLTRTNLINDNPRIITLKIEPLNITQVYNKSNYSIVITYPSYPDLYDFDGFDIWITAKDPLAFPIIDPVCTPAFTDVTGTPKRLNLHVEGIASGPGGNPDCSIIQNVNLVSNANRYEVSEGGQLRFSIITVENPETRKLIIQSLSGLINNFKMDNITIKTYFPPQQYPVYIEIPDIIVSNYSEFGIYKKGSVRLT